MVNRSVNYQDPGMDAVFSALADPIRRGMVTRLTRGPATVGELGEPYPITKPAVTRHVRVLERAGLVRRRRDGRIHRCTLRPEPLSEAERWLERHRRFWEGTLDRLARFVEDIQPEGDDR